MKQQAEVGFLSLTVLAIGFILISCSQLTNGKSVVPMETGMGMESSRAEGLAAVLQLKATKCLRNGAKCDPNKGPPCCNACYTKGTCGDYVR